MNQCKGKEVANGDARIVGLTVRFVGGGPTEETVAAAHRAVRRARLTPPLTLTVRWAEAGTKVDSLQLTLVGGAGVRATGPALLPAIHELCAHAASLQSASHQDGLR